MHRVGKGIKGAWSPWGGKEGSLWRWQLNGVWGVSRGSWLGCGGGAVAGACVCIWGQDQHGRSPDCPGSEQCGRWGHLQFSSVQLLSCVWLFATPWTAARQASLSITNSWSLPKLMSIESVMPSNHLILCRPLLLLPSIFPTIRVFSNESVLCMRWPKYWSFSFCISSTNEHPGLISFWMDWLDFLAVQGTLESFPQHCSSKPSILWCSAFFIVQLSHPYMTTGKTVALTRRTFFGKVMFLPFHMLSRLVITFLSRNKRLLISWLQSPYAVILEPPPPNKVSYCFHCFPIYLPWGHGTECHDLSFLKVEL